MPPKQTRPKNCAWTAQGKGGRPFHFIPLPHSRIQPPKRKRRSSSLNIEPPTTPRGSKTQGTYGSPPVTPNKEVATLIEQLNAWLGESEALENLTPQESQMQRQWLKICWLMYSFCRMLLANSLMRWSGLRNASGEPFFLRFPRTAGETRRQYNARMKHNARYQEMYWARHNWIHRFVKWGQIHQLVSGSFDYVEHPELLELLRIRTASYSGFFAKHFPKDKPTPKQYFALTHAVEFLAENDFSGEGDEQPMETLHH